MKSTSLNFFRCILILLSLALGATSWGQVGRGYFELQTQFSGQGNVSVNSLQGNPHGSVSITGAKIYRNPGQNQSPWNEVVQGKIKVFLVWKRADLEAAPTHVYVDPSWDIRAGGSVSRRVKVSAPDATEGVDPYPQYPWTYNVGPVRPTTYPYFSDPNPIWGQNNKPGSVARIAVPESGTVQVGEFDLDCFAIEQGNASASITGKLNIEFSYLHRNLTVSKCYDATPSKVFTTGAQTSAVQGTTRSFDFPKAIFPGVKLTNIQWDGNADVPYTWWRAFDGENWQEGWRKEGRTAKLEVDALEGCTPTSPLNFTIAVAGNSATGSAVAFGTATSNSFVRLRPRVLGMQPDDVVTFASVELTPNADVWPVVTPPNTLESRIEVSEKKLSVNPFTIGWHTFNQRLVSRDPSILLHIGPGSSTPLSVYVTAAPAITLAPEFSLAVSEGKKIDIDLPIQGGVKPYTVEREYLPESVRVNEDGHLWGLWDSSQISDLTIRVTDSCNTSTLIIIPVSEGLPELTDDAAAGLLGFPMWPQNTAAETVSSPGLPGDAGALSTENSLSFLTGTQPIGGGGTTYIKFSGFQKVNDLVVTSMCDSLKIGEHPLKAISDRGPYVWSIINGDPHVGYKPDATNRILITTSIPNSNQTKIMVSSDSVATELSLKSKAFRKFDQAIVETFDQNLIRLAKAFPEGSGAFEREFLARKFSRGNKVKIRTLWRLLATLPDNTHLMSYLPSRIDWNELQHARSGVKSLFWNWNWLEKQQIGVYARNMIFMCENSWISQADRYLNGVFVAVNDASKAHVTPPPSIFPVSPNETSFLKRKRQLKYLCEVLNNSRLRMLSIQEKAGLTTALEAWKKTNGAEKLAGWYVKKMPPLTSGTAKAARGLGAIAGGAIIIYSAYDGYIQIKQAENKPKAIAKAVGGVVAVEGALSITTTILGSGAGAVLCATPAGAVAVLIGTGIFCFYAYQMGQDAVEWIWETTFTSLTTAKGT